MVFDKAGHGETVDFVLRLEELCQFGIRVDEATILLVLASIFLSVVPDSFGDLSARTFLEAGNRAKKLVQDQNLFDTRHD